MTRGVAPRALRSPISRMRSVTDTSMMFITPMPPTSREMPAMPAEEHGQRLVHRGGRPDQRLVSGVMVKSASAGVVMPWRLSELGIDLLVGGRQRRRRGGLDEDVAHRVAAGPPEQLGRRPW